MQKLNEKEWKEKFIAKLMELSPMLDGENPEEYTDFLKEEADSYYASMDLLTKDGYEDPEEAAINEFDYAYQDVGGDIE